MSLKKCMVLWCCITAVVWLQYFPNSMWSSVFWVVALWIYLFVDKRIIDEYHYVRFKFSKIQHDIDEKTLSVLWWRIIIAKICLFPLFFSLYLLVLFLEQTQLLSLQYTLFFLVLDKWIILFVTCILAVIILLDKANNHAQYVYRVQSPYLGGLYALFCGLLAVSMIWLLWWQLGAYTHFSHLFATWIGSIVLLIWYLLLAHGHDIKT